MASVTPVMRRVSRHNVKAACNHRENFGRRSAEECEFCVKVPFPIGKKRSMVVLPRSRTCGCDKLYAGRLLTMQKRISASELAAAVPLPGGTSPAPGSESGRAIARIHILGPMRATSYLGQDILPVGRKARAILGCLCLAGGQRLARTRLAAMLWDRVPEFQARASLP